MNYELIFDSVTTSTAPYSIFVSSLVFLAVGGLWSAWLRHGHKSIHAGAKFFLGVGIVVMLIGLLSVYERHRISKRTDWQSAEGALAGLWTKDVRQKNSGKSTYTTVTWEGFSINGVPFSYRRGEGDNYFQNAGSSTLALQDGMQLRVRYLVEGAGSDAVNKIIRMERAL